MYTLELNEESSTFEIQNNNLFYNRKLLISWLDGAKINLSVRRNITSDTDVKLFDRILFGIIGAGIKYDYVGDLNTLYKPTERYEAFVSGKEEPTEDMIDYVYVDLEIPREYVKLAPKILESAKKFYKNNYSIPKYKYAAGELNIEKMFPEDYADSVRKWVFENGSYPHTYDLTRKLRSEAQTYNLLRIKDYPSGKRIESLAGEKFTATVAERVYRYCDSYWAGETTNPYKSFRDYQLTVRDDFISYGCQTVPRSEVERIAKLMGWNK
jgi:hypothetical protein